MNPSFAHESAAKMLDELVCKLHAQNEWLARLLRDVEQANLPMREAPAVQRHPRARTCRS